MSRPLLLVLIFLFVLGCKQEATKESEALSTGIPLDSIIKQYHNPTTDYVMVIAHRADWRTFPENSLEAIRSAIELGVDMVEIDVRKTRDGQLVVMHDETVDRTTNGTGKVAELTFAQIDSLRLMSGVGVPTDYKVPTLRQALMECKGKIMVNLDKADNYFDAIYPILKETNTLGQVILKGHYTPEEFKSKFGDFYQEIIYMPLITAKIEDVKGYVDALEASLDPSCYEIVFNASYMDGFHYIPAIQDRGDNIWINTLWEDLAIDKTDDKAYWNPDENWGWVIEQGATMIQTDRPRELIAYLTRIGKH